MHLRPDVPRPGVGGFSPEQMTDWLSAAGLDRARYTPLPVDADAKGPALFVMAAEKQQ